MANNKKYKKLVENTVLFAANAVATKLISFVLLPLYTAYMSAGEYGIVDMAQIVVNLVTPAATLAIADAAIRFMIKDGSQSSEYAAISFFVTIISVPIVWLFSPLLSLSVFGGLGQYSFWFVVSYATGAILGLFGQIARGLEEIKLIPISALCSSIVTLLAAYFSVGRAGLGVKGYFISLCIGQIVGSAIYVFGGNSFKVIMHGFRDLMPSTCRRDKITQPLSDMLKYSLPLVPNSLFWWIGTSVSRLFITGMLGISASGMYAAASKVPALLNTAYSIFQQAWQLSAFQELDGEDIEEFFSTVFKALQAAMTFICAVLSLFAPTVASLFLKGETFNSWPMIPVLLLANLFSLYSSFYGTIYTSTLHTGFIMKTTIVAAVATASLTPLFLNAFGLFGACAATAISQALVAAVRAVDSKKYINFDPGLCATLTTLVLLIIQAAVTFMQIDQWQIISLCCVIVVFVIQLHSVKPLAQKFLRFRRNAF